MARIHDRGGVSPRRNQDATPPPQREMYVLKFFMKERGITNVIFAIISQKPKVLSNSTSKLYMKEKSASNAKSVTQTLDQVHTCTGTLTGSIKTKNQINCNFFSSENKVDFT